MQYIKFHDKEFYDIAVLIKSKAFNKTAMEQWYVNDIKSKSVIGLDLDYVNNKAPVKQVIDPCITNLLPIFNQLGIKFLVVADGNYYKRFTKVSKVDSLYGYVKPCAIEGYEHIKVVLVPNYETAFFDTKAKDKIKLSIDALNNALEGTYEDIGTNVIHSAQYIPASVPEVREALGKLYQYPSLTCDIEAFSLVHNRAGIGTIGFAWDKHNGICIDVDHGRITTGYVDDYTVAGVMLELRDFFINYKGNIKYHNCTYDIKVLIRWLFMEHLMDTEGLLRGLEVMTRDFDCTQAITYLATNSTSENKLSLKDQSQEFLGNYAVDVKNIRKAKSEDLMKYNLMDCLATWYVYDKNYPIMVNDEQLDFYNTMAKPILKNIIQMELTGMPLNMDRVLQVNRKLSRIVDRYTKYLMSTETIQAFTQLQKVDLCEEYNRTHKKQKMPNDMVYEFNCGSPKQLATLIHDYMGLDVVSTTPTGTPETGGKVLKGHCKRTTNKEHANILRSIIKIEEGKKILSTFISKFIEAERDDSGWYWLFGSFKFGGTISGRLSSNSPVI